MKSRAELLNSITNEPNSSVGESTESMSLFKTNIQGILVMIRRELVNLMLKPDWNTHVAIHFLETIMDQLNNLKMTVTKRKSLVSFSTGFNEIIALLNSTIESCRLSLFERTLCLKNDIKMFIPPNFVSSSKANIEHALVTLANHEKIVMIAPVDLLAIIQIHGEKGLASSAGLGLKKMVCDEIVRRMKAHCYYSTNNEYAECLYQFLKQDVRFSAELNAAMNELLCEAFRKINSALFEGQTSRFKTNFIQDKYDLSANELLAIIKDRSLHKPHSRTAYAWTLTQKYYKDSSENNRDLLNAIYHYSYCNSGFFRCSSLKSHGLFQFRTETTMTDKEIAEGKLKEDSRIAKICHALSG